MKQYKKFKLSSGKTAKSILISCGARLAPFDIPQLREVMAYDELELDRIGDRKTAVFFIISDTTQTYNFLVALAFSLGDEKGFEWIGAYDITADELLTGTDTAKTESKTAQAEMLILELLADGKKMPSAELEKAVNDRGISSRTMRTAKSRIGDRLVTEKDGTAWVCYLRS